MFTEKDHRWFKCAISRAGKSKHYKAKVAAFLVGPDKTSCLVSSTNLEKSHPIQKYFNVKYRGFSEDACHHYLHAEISCLTGWHSFERNFPNLKGYNMYIARVDKKGNPKLARPCPACMAAIKNVGIKDIYYTTNKGYAYERIEKI